MSPGRNVHAGGNSLIFCDVSARRRGRAEGSQYGIRRPYMLMKEVPLVLHENPAVSQAAAFRCVCPFRVKRCVIKHEGASVLSYLRVGVFGDTVSPAGTGRHGTNGAQVWLHMCFGSLTSHPDAAVAPWRRGKTNTVGRRSNTQDFHPRPANDLVTSEPK